MKKDLKILNITHHDLDGVVSAIVLRNVFDDVTTVPVSYNDLDSVVDSVGVSEDYCGFDAIITTDINLKRRHTDHLSKAAPIYIHLDHHQDEDGIDNGKNIIVDPSKCGALNTKDFFEFNLGVDLKHLDHLVEVTDDYDRWIHNTKWSKPLNYLYEMYGFEAFKEKFHNGFDPKKLMPTEVKYLTEVGNRIQSFWESVQSFPNNAMQSNMKRNIYQLIYLKF